MNLNPGARVPLFESWNSYLLVMSLGKIFNFDVSDSLSVDEDNSSTLPQKFVIQWTNTYKVFL